MEAVAQRIAEGKVPAALTEMRVMSLSAEALALLAPNREMFDDLTKLRETVAKSAKLMFVDGPRGPEEATKKIPGEGLVGVLKFAMQEAGLQCIGATTEARYKAVCVAYPALDKVFRPLHVKPLEAEGAMTVLRARKEKLETFHQVTFPDDVLNLAVQETDSYLKEKLLPGKALELLDAAAATVKVRTDETPSEITDVKTRLAFIALRLESAIPNHEFEKAKFLSG